MKDFNEMGKKELRAECKEAGIKGYSKMTVGAMREELFKHYTNKEEETVEVPAEPQREEVNIDYQEFLASLELDHEDNCPHCGVGLDNGISDFDQLVEIHGKKKAHDYCTRQFQCMACNGEWGPLVGGIGTGIKIEKDRPEQNGVTRPSAGGKCRAIWDACDAFYAEAKRVPMPKQMKAMAEENGWNANNAVIEMYQWRKFHGFTGRQK